MIRWVQEPKSKEEMDREKEEWQKQHMDQKKEKEEKVKKQGDEVRG